MALYVHYSVYTVSVLKVPTNGVLGFSSAPTYVDVEYVDLKFSAHSHMMSALYFDPLVTMYKNILLQIPSGERIYDPTTQVWSIRKEKFDIIFLTAQKILHADLKLDILNNWTSPSTTTGRRSTYGTWDIIDESEKEIPSAEDFFYNTTQPQAANRNLSVDQLVDKITHILSEAGISDTDLATAYKKAARKLHPDLNGGNAEKMTELNMYWQQYKQLQKLN